MKQKLKNIGISKHMGQKVNPIREQVRDYQKGSWIQTGRGKDFSAKLVEDTRIREYLNARLAKASISKIIIERTLKLITRHSPYTACSGGTIIGKGGQEVHKLKARAEENYEEEVQINIFKLEKKRLGA